MTPAARSLATRVAIALLVAAAAIAALQTFVAAHERAQPAIAPRPAPPPSPLAGLPFPLATIEGAVLLAARADAFAPDVAPVLQVTVDGAVLVRRGPRPPAAPGPVATANVGVVLPRTPIGEWSPAARTALVELLGVWMPQRPLDRSRVRVVDDVLSAAQVQFVGSWVP